jgi:hypothetical protein
LCWRVEFFFFVSVGLWCIGAMTLFKWRQNARYLNGAKMGVIEPE